MTFNKQTALNNLDPPVLFLPWMLLLKKALQPSQDHTP